MSNPLIRDDGTHAVTNEQLDTQEVRRRQEAVAMKSPEHLKRWLVESGHGWLVMNTGELIDALPWPGGVATVMDLVHCYADHRRTIDTGRREYLTEPLTGRSVEVVVFKSEALDLEEINKCLRFLAGLAREIDPNWTIIDAAYPEA